MDESSKVDRAIAVVGMSCRLPDAPGVESYWQNLLAGVESVRFWSDDELAAAGVSEAALRDPRFVRAGAIVAGTDLFDAALFGLGRREAEIMDPQHRLFLECAWEALERAGINPDAYEGLIGVYAGAGANAYAWNNLRPNLALVAALGEFRLMVASDKDFLPTQVAYRLNLRGPAVSVQTACSSSLVAVHLAAQALLTYDCDVALAGGVHCAVPQKAGYWYDEGGILSPDGHCRTFDERAAGTTVGEGAGIVVLKRLSDALADGDAIAAVLRGTAINNDGAAKIGFTAPSENGQADVIATAQAVAGVAPETVTLIEAHGTGTALGDPIEVAALTQVFRQGTDRRAFCALGSVKSNFGHLDAAAGVAGLIKVVLALEHGLIPPSLGFERPNPKIPLAESPFFVPTEALPWPRQDAPRRAGVSSFGIGGTNAHAVVEEAPEHEASGPARRWQWLPLSARSPAALGRLAGALADFLEAHAELPLADAAHTLRQGRRELPCRAAVVAADSAGAARRLREVTAETARDGGRPLVFLFPGQGSQHLGLARGLYEDEPIFRAHLDECSALLAPTLGLALPELLFAAGEEAAARLRRPACGGRASRSRLSSPSNTAWLASSSSAVSNRPACWVTAWGSTSPRPSPVCSLCPRPSPWSRPGPG